MEESKESKTEIKSTEEVVTEKLKIYFDQVEESELSRRSLNIILKNRDIQLSSSPDVKLFECKTSSLYINSFELVKRRNLDDYFDFAVLIAFDIIFVGIPYLLDDIYQDQTFAYKSGRAFIPTRLNVRTVYLLTATDGVRYLLVTSDKFNNLIRLEDARKFDYAVDSTGHRMIVGYPDIYNKHGVEALLSEGGGTKYARRKKHQWTITEKKHKCKDGVVRRVHVNGSGKHAVRCKVGDQFKYKMIKLE